MHNVIDTAKLQEVLERLRLSERPDRELDCSLFMLNPPPTFGGHYITRYAWHGSSIAVHVESDDTSYQEAFSLPSYTSSVAAALELVGRFYSQTTVRLEASGWAEITFPDGRHAEADHNCGPALAVLVALLKAKIAKGSTHLRD